MKGALGPSSDTSDPTIQVLLVQLLFFAPIGIWFVMAWRCAPNVINTRWTVIVRVLVAICACSWIISIIYDSDDVHKAWVARSTIASYPVAQREPAMPQAQPDAPLSASQAAAPASPPTQPEWVMSKGTPGDVVHRYTTSAGDVAFVREVSSPNEDSVATWKWLTQWYAKKGYHISKVQNAVLDNGSTITAANLDAPKGSAYKGLESLYLMLNPNGEKWALVVQPGSGGRNADFEGRLTRLITTIAQW